MGCHTWYHKKVNISCEDIKKELGEILSNSIFDLRKIVGDSSKENGELSSYMNIYSDLHLMTTVDSIIELFEYNNIDFDDYVCDEYFDIFDCHVKDRGFYSDLDYDLPHDIFRIGGYPDDMLFSMEETLNYIEKNKDKIEFCRSDWKECLELYWEKFPDGMIDFG